MKKIFIFLIVISATLNLHSQSEITRRYTAPAIGLKIGLNHSTFKYTDPNLQALPHNLHINPNFGLFVEFHLNDHFSIAPEFFLYNRGHLTKYVYEGNYNVTYEVNSKYFTTRIPVYYRFNLVRQKNIKPFLVIAPSYNHLLGGNISLHQPDLSISEASVDIGSANMRQQDFSFFFGAGTQFNINCGDFSLVTKVELGYNVGLTNSFSDHEINENSKAENINAYNITGERKIRNIELNVTVGLPLKFSHDNACWECKKREAAERKHRKQKSKGTNKPKKFYYSPF